MARRTKVFARLIPPVIEITSTPASVTPIEDIAEAIGRSVAKEISAELQKLIQFPPNRGGQTVPSLADGDQISMDESIIPMAIDIQVTEKNLDDMAKKETAKDKDLAGAKNKLAALRKGKKK